MSRRTFASPTARLSAAVTGKGRELSPERAIERAATELTRRVVHLQAKQRKLRAALKETGAAIKTAKRELRAVLQRSSAVTFETLDVAGQADGTDRAIALAEQPRMTNTATVPALTEGVVERMTNDGSIGTGPDRNVAGKPDDLGF